MMYFKRKKIKLSLIDDYVKILLIKNFLNNSFENVKLTNITTLKQTKELNLKLDEIYNQLFFKLKLNDLSLLILKKELKNNNILYLKEEQNSFLTLENTIQKTYLILNDIFENLNKKLKFFKFKLNF